ncbi:hypothetical protein THII_1041 [Thioploca ingrica]|uniref:Uncharacterized protein n=1 Tax=Thioploca ingrica TaxID=40754 RepID=A0A090ACB3_9GAMM|nr:hypothetical protein THII_1041 [Thioploca ingrica]
MLQLNNSFSKEFQQNLRLRIGSGLIVIILVTYAILELNDYHHRFQQDYHNAVAQLSQLQTVATQKQWPDRAAETQQLLTQLEARLWQANTKGLAQATFQKWFNDQVNLTKINNARLTVDPAIEVEHYSYLWQVTAQLEGQFESNKVNNLLLAIAQNIQMTVTERFDIFPSASNPKFTLIITAYFQKV